MPDKLKPPPGYENWLDALLATYSVLIAMYEATGTQPNSIVDWRQMLDAARAELAELRRKAGE